MMTDTTTLVLRTPEEIAKLKRDWLADACWQLEDTEGFEAHRDELRAYREEKEAAWTRQYEAHTSAVKAQREAAHASTPGTRVYAAAEAVRRPVGVSEFAESGGAAYTMVVCDDGSCWTLTGVAWVENAPIPGTARWYEQNPLQVGAK